MLFAIAQLPFFLFFSLIFDPHPLLFFQYAVIQAIYRYFQKAIQPIFSSIGFGFKGIEGLCITEAASDKSGNERTVTCVKQAKFITDGVISPFRG
jgi:hypothetical protein